MAKNYSIKTTKYILLEEKQEYKYGMLIKEKIILEKKRNMDVSTDSYKRI